MEERIEVMETENTELMDNCDVELCESGSGSGIGKVLVIGLGIAAVAAGAAVVCKDKIKAWNTKRRIAKLKKDGYVVVEPEYLEDSETQDFDDEVVEETEE